MKPSFGYLSRVMKTIMTSPQPPAEVRPPGEDAAALARELSRTFMERLRDYRKARDGDLSLCDLENSSWEKFLEAYQKKSPDEVSFDELERLSREHPEQALARWEEIKATAREDIGNGWHAARDVSCEAWDRACYLAIREQLRETFPPRTGFEAMLLDEMAQYELVRRRLMSQLRQHAWSSAKNREQLNRIPATILQTVDRLQRLCQYALRTLLALRRARTPVVVQNSGPSRLDGGSPADRATDPLDGENPE